MLEHPLLAPATGGPATRGAALMGLGHALAGREVPTEDVAARLGVDADWIIRRTGIRSRRWVAPGETLAGLATRAGQAALEDAGVDAADLDLVLVATMSPDQLCPSAAPVIAYRLGAERAGAMDVNAACNGFVSALSLAAAQVETGRARRILVIGAEVLSKWVDRDDRRTAGLFADGAAAVVVGPGDAEIGPVILRHDGALAGAIFASHAEQQIRMDGHETFKAAVASMSELGVEACAAAGIAIADVDTIVLHQANQRILTAVAERLGVPEERMVDYIGQTGNTSAASIPLALSLARADGRMTAGDTVLIAAVGAGFTAGALVLTWGLT